MQAKDVATKPAQAKTTSKKPRPCCGRHQKNCPCQPPKGMKKMHLTALAKRYAKTALFSVKDTTDIKPWLDHMQHATKQLPLRVLLAYAHSHAVFNQEPLLKAFIDRKAFLFKTPWFDWQMLQSIVKKTQGRRQNMAILKLQKYHFEKVSATEPPWYTFTKTYE